MGINIVKVAALCSFNVVKNVFQSFVVYCYVKYTQTWS